MRTVFPAQVGDAVPARSNDLPGFFCSACRGCGSARGFRRPGVRRGRGPGRRGAAGFRIPGGGCDRWRLPAVAAARCWMRVAVGTAARPGGGRRWRRTSISPRNLLPVEPGSGDAGLACEAGQGDGLAGGVHPPQCRDGALAGLLGSLFGGRDDVAGVVSSHRLPRRWCLCRSRRSCGQGWRGPGRSFRRAGPGRCSGDVDQGERAASLLA